MAAYQQEKRMPFMTIFERVGMEQGLLRGLEVSLQLKFGAEGLKLMPELRELQDHELLDAVLDAIPGQPARRSCADCECVSAGRRARARRAHEGRRLDDRGLSSRAAGVTHRS
jgi:hypothetical protein